MILRMFGLLVGSALLSGITAGQVASGGQFTLDQSVLATGGGTSAGGSLKVEGTAGQSTAGQKATASAYSVHAGFWNPAPLGPSAASVPISGRVLTADGRGIRNAAIVVSAVDGTIRRAFTGSLGYFRFDEIAVGETYVISVSSKRFQFAAPTSIISVQDEISDVTFIALPN